MVSTDWSEPLISPLRDQLDSSSSSLTREHQGGSPNRGRHLRIMLRLAGPNVTEFMASYCNAATPEAVQTAVSGYVSWLESLQLFDQVAELGWVDHSTLERIGAGMRQRSSTLTHFSRPESVEQ